jgi:hypothetical protein
MPSTIRAFRGARVASTWFKKHRELVARDVVPTAGEQDRPRHASVASTAVAAAFP